jgi:hypothetical protein
MNLQVFYAIYVIFIIKTPKLLHISEVLKFLPALRTFDYAILKLQRAIFVS